MTGWRTEVLVHFGRAAVAAAPLPDPHRPPAPPQVEAVAEPPDGPSDAARTFEVLLVTAAQTRVALFGSGRTAPPAGRRPTRAGSAPFARGCRTFPDAGRLPRVFASGLVPLLTGCAGPPAVNVVGSYFPAWMLCTLIGVAAAACFRQVLVLCRLEHQLILPLVTHAAVALVVTLAIWLLWFGH